MNTESIMSALGARLSGRTWMIQCPAHDDRTPSCSCTFRGGKLLVHCHAGCSQEAVLEGLRQKGLWPIDQISGAASPSAELRPARRCQTIMRRLVATYTYTDEAGVLLFEVLRYEPGRDGRRKDFSQRSRDRSGRWQWTRGSTEVLYRLSEMLAAEMVFIVEGEKDVESMRQRGLVATCNAGGAGKWRSTYNAAFKGKTVVIIPDSDQPGIAHAHAIYCGVRPFANRVLLIDLEDAKDVSEWFELGHEATELRGIVEATTNAAGGLQHG